MTIYAIKQDGTNKPTYMVNEKVVSVEEFDKVLLAWEKDEEGD